jgi:hypothetical protein
MHNRHYFVTVESNSTSAYVKYYVSLEDAISYADEAEEQGLMVTIEIEFDPLS